MSSTPSPVYPPFLSWWVPHALLHFFKAPLLATAVCIVMAPAYHSLAAQWRHSDVAWFIAGTMLIHAVLYYALNGFFLLCDVHHCFTKYKIPRTQRMIPSTSLIVSTILQGTIAQIFVAPIPLYLVYTYVVPDPKPPMTSPLPNALTLFRHFFCANLFTEVCFYATHRTFHEIPWLYRFAHKKHHQYVGSIGFAAEYAHPLEMILGNQFSTAGYFLASAVHPFIWFVWLAWRLSETYESHSGYCFRGSWPERYLGLTNGNRAEFHDFHHTDNRGNYGSEVVDYIFGTMDSWLIQK